MKRLNPLTNRLCIPHAGGGNPIYVRDYGTETVVFPTLVGVIRDPMGSSLEGDSGAVTLQGMEL